MSDKQLVFRFDELGPEHNDIVGKKCANLGKMIGMGLAVPPGFALSIDMYREFIRLTGIDAQLAAYVEQAGDLKGAGIAQFEALGSQLRSTIEDQAMPPELRELIATHYHRLCDTTGVENLAVYNDPRELQLGFTLHAGQEESVSIRKEIGIGISRANKNHPKCAHPPLGTEYYSVNFQTEPPRDCAAPHPDEIIIWC